MLPMRMISTCDPPENVRSLTGDNNMPRFPDEVLQDCINPMRCIWDQYYLINVTDSDEAGDSLTYSDKHGPIGQSHEQIRIRFNLVG